MLEGKLTPLMRRAKGKCIEKEERFVGVRVPSSLGMWVGSEERVDLKEMN